MVTHVRMVETRTEAMRRLLDVARESGVKLGMDNHGGYFDPEPTPPALASCPVCHGTGTECGTVPSGRTWRYENVVCTSCHGTGQRTAAAA